MLKRLIILVLEFGAGLVGNLMAGYIQQDVWGRIYKLGDHESLSSFSATNYTNFHKFTLSVRVNS